MELSSRPYNAKILLFGEYTLLLDSMALSIPFPGFSGRWRRAGEEAAVEERVDALASSQMIRDYLQWLTTADLQMNGEPALDLHSLEQDLEDRLYFSSTIPMGWGVGSSGALVAALYDRYGIEKIAAPDQNFSSGQLMELQQLFSSMEAFFHGRSSGLDPLNAYVGRPLWIHHRKEIQMIAPPLDVTSLLSSVFLIDTGQAGQTRPMVEWFVKSCKDQDYFERLREELIPANNRCVKAFLSGNQSELLDDLYRLSTFQFRYFQKMIPPEMTTVWKQGLDNGSYLLKLCGSGGGGFLLGFWADEEQERINLNAQGIRPLAIYQPV